jgi:signal transduction histidine kinase
MSEIKTLSVAPGTTVSPVIRRRQATSDNKAQHQSRASVGRFAGDQIHDLGNLLIGIAFCLKRLRGSQRTEELEELVEQAANAADQGVEAVRALLRATHLLLKMASHEPGRAAI